MPSKNFSIWDKELTQFLSNVQNKHIDTTHIEKWFTEAGPMEIVRGEAATLIPFMKEFMREKARFPDLSATSMKGYMLDVLLHVKSVFLAALSFDKEEEIFIGKLKPPSPAGAATSPTSPTDDDTYEDYDTEEINLGSVYSKVVAEFDAFIFAAVNNHKDFFALRAEVTSTRLNEYIKTVEKPYTPQKQNDFVERQFQNAIDNEEKNHPNSQLHQDCINFLNFTRSVNELMTPGTAMRTIFLENSGNGTTRGISPNPSPRTSPNLGQSHSPSTQLRRGLEGLNVSGGKDGSPMSIHRLLSNRFSSSRAELKPDDALGSPRSVTHSLKP